MKKTFEKRTATKRGLAKQLTKALAVAVALLAAATLAAPAPAAAASTEIAHLRNAAGDDMGYFTSVSDILCDKTYDACAAGGKLYMIEDWTLTSEVEIPKGKTLTIDMNGHLIDGQEQYGIKLYDNANLTLEASPNEKREFTYNGYTWDHSRDWWEFGNTYDYKENFSITTGGLFARGYTGTNGAIAMMGDGCTVTLKNVAMGGFKSDIGPGAISANANCTINLESGTVIEHGKSSRGAVGSNDVGSKRGNLKLNMTNAVIRDNYCGAIEAYGLGAEITMNDNSKLEGNASFSNGGGISFLGANFKLTGDGTGVINNNWAARNDSAKGGGIYVAGDSNSTSALIENVTISNNRSGVDGGGLYLKQEGVTVRNCKITGNSVRKGDGGAIYINNDGNTISNCTITGNHSADEGGAVYVNDDASIDGCTITGNWCAASSEGGGAFVSYKYDLKMTGLCIVKGNTRGENGSADDVFLNTISGQTGFAYITGGVSKGSCVGVRTPNDGDRRIGDNIKNDSDDSFFIDLTGYYVSYGTDHGGDMWQRKRTLEFEVKLDGVSQGRYKEGATVTLNGAGGDAGSVFRRWSESSTGLYPFSDYVKDASDAQLTFKMPQHDVKLVTERTTRIESVELSMDEVRAGKLFPTAGTLRWTDPDTGEAKELEVGVTWTEGGDTDPAAPRASYYTSYTAHFSVAQDLDDNRAFAIGMGKGGVKITAGGTVIGTASAAVDAAGRLTVVSEPVATGKPGLKSVEAAAVSLYEGASESDLRALLPDWALVESDEGISWPLETDKTGVNLGSLVKDGLVVRPEDGSATVYLPLKESDRVAVKSGDMLKVTVTVLEKGAAATSAPDVAPADGTYSTTDSLQQKVFDNGKLKVTATCGTAGATIMYRTQQKDGDGKWGAWSAETEWPAGDLKLEPNAGALRSYRVEVWAVKDSAESVHVVRGYTIDDVQPAKTCTVTVKYSDTAAKGQQGAKGDDVHTVESGKDLSITAPYREGYAFERWTGTGSDDVTDATLTLKNVTANRTVTAVYNPVVSGIDLHLSAPEAHKELAQSATKVMAKAGASSDYTDVTSYFAQAGDKVPVDWVPGAGEDGKAAHVTAYVSRVALNGSAADDVKYALSPAAEVRVNGGTTTAEAYIEEDGGKTYLCVKWPATGKPKVSSLADPEAVELSFSEALAAQEAQGAGEGADGWDLPQTVEVSYACGESEPLDVAWGEVAGFDPANLEAQVLTVKGTVQVPDYADAGDGKVSNEVTVKIKIAAATTAEVPTATPEPGTHKGAQKVELVCATEGATIRYTTDGTEPTEKSAEYTGAIEVARTTTIKAKAYRRGLKPSKTATFAYTIAHEVTFDAAGGSEVAAQTVEDGKRAKRPDDPTREDCTFEGWFTEDGDEYDFDAKVEDDLKLYAHWSKNGDGAKKDEDANDPDKGDKKDDGSQGSPTTKTTVTTKKQVAYGKAIPATGDRTPLIVGLLVVLGILAAAAGIITKRRKK